MTTITPGDMTRGRMGAATMDPRMKARREAVAEQERQERVGALIFIVCLVLAGLGGFALLKSSAFDVERLRVETTGAHPSSPEAISAIVTAADIANGTPLIDVPLDEARARVAALPWVDSVATRRSWGGEVTFTVTPREVAAQVRSGDGRYLQIDKAGRVIETRQIAAAGVVEVQGLTLDATPGQWLDGRGIDLVAVASSVPSDIATAAQSLEADAGGLALRLHSGAAVVLGDGRDLDAKFDALRAFLVGIDLRCLDRLDIRAPSVPVIKRDTQCLPGAGQAATSAEYGGPGAVGLPAALSPADSSAVHSSTLDQ